MSARKAWVVVFRLPGGPFLIATLGGEPLTFPTFPPADFFAGLLVEHGAEEAVPIRRTYEEIAAARDNPEPEEAA